MIVSYPMISRTCHFVLVPGPLDITLNSILPRRPLLSSFVSRMKNKVPNVHFATNPCRIKFFGQEIVIFREDIMARMLRNTIRVKQEAEGDDLRRFVSCAAPVTIAFSHCHGLACIVHSGSKSSNTSDSEYSTNVIRLRPLSSPVPVTDSCEYYSSHSKRI